MSKAFSFVPTIMQGETVYSWLTRWALQSGMPTQQAALNHLLGARDNIQLMSLFPGYIPALVKLSGLTASELIYKHTVVNYFKLFSDQHTYHLAIQALAQGQAKKLFKTLSITANRVPDSDYLSYCPICAFQDYDSLGTPYWHLEHQLPGVTTCLRHGSALKQCEKGRSKLILPPLFAEKPQLVQTSPSAIKLSALSCEILRDSHPSVSVSSLLNGYRERLYELGMAAPSGSIKQSSLREHLDNFWADIAYQVQVKAIFNLGADEKFPTCLFRGYATQRHPLKHLLLIGSIFHSVSECLDYSHQTKDLFLLSAPLLDKNQNLRHATHEKELEKLIVEKLLNGKSLRETAQNLGKHVDTVKAIAISKGIRIKRRTKRLYIDHRRTIWRQLVIGMSTKEIAITIKCSDAAIQKELRCYPELTKLRKKIRFYKKRSEHREKILWLLASKTKPTRSLLQNRARSSYTWLFKHDKQWLYENLPQSVPRKMRPPNAK